MIYNLVQKNRYLDSVLLMHLSSRLSSFPGVKRINVLSATPANLELLAQAGLLNSEGAAASSTDLLIALEGENLDPEKLLEELENFLQPGKSVQDEDSSAISLSGALKSMPETDLVFFSIPGPFVFDPAQAALNNGCHLMIFSDNVPKEDELKLKQLAAEKNLLVMGPDCGTAIINGTGLGFFNQVNRGEIGMVGASGTGIQQVTSLISELGEGISHALGTGSSDLKAPINGLAFGQGMKMLSEDNQTKLIILISKPPKPEVAQKILNQAEQLGKPVLVCFLGQPTRSDSPPLYFSNNLEETALKAIPLLKGKLFLASQWENRLNSLRESARKLNLPSEGKYLRGLFSGGTFCSEAEFILQPLIGEIYSNVTPQPEFQLSPPFASRGHTLLDLGEDYFTKGKPHPMIDLTSRLERIKKEAEDPQTAVILLDLVLGFGSHLDPAPALVPLIKEISSAPNSPIIVIGVCGTQNDPQDCRRQSELLRQAGAYVFSASTSAAYFAGFILSERS